MSCLIRYIRIHIHIQPAHKYTQTMPYHTPTHWHTHAYQQTTSVCHMAHIQYTQQKTITKLYPSTGKKNTFALTCTNLSASFGLAQFWCANKSSTKYIRIYCDVHVFQSSYLLLVLVVLLLMKEIKCKINTTRKIIGKSVESIARGRA